MLLLLSQMTLLLQFPTRSSNWISALPKRWYEIWHFHWGADRLLNVIRSSRCASTLHCFLKPIVLFLQVHKMAVIMEDVRVAAVTVFQAQIQIHSAWHQCFTAFFSICNFSTTSWQLSPRFFRCVFLTSWLLFVSLTIWSLGSSSRNKASAEWWD